MVYRFQRLEKILCGLNAERTRLESWDRVHQGSTANRAASGASVVTDERSEDDTSEARASVASASNASVVVVVTVVRAKRGRYVVVIIMRA